MIPGEEGGGAATVEGIGVTMTEKPVMGGILSQSLKTVQESQAKTAEAQPLDTPAAPGERPAWCPEQFWDGTKQAVRTESVIKSYNDMRAEANRLRNEGRANDPSPATPEAYFPETSFKDGKLVLPESAANWGDIAKDDPMLGAFAKACHEKGIGQKQFSELLPKVLESFAPLLPAPIDVEAELAKLDGNTPGSGREFALSVARRIQALQTHGELSEDEVGFWQGVAGTAEGVRALAKMLNQRDDGQRIPTGKALAGSRMSREEWNSEMRANAEKLDKDEGYRNAMLAKFPGE